MDRETDSRHYVRRVVLPSGKTIEVVYFDEAPELDVVSSDLAEVGEDLHVCDACSSDLVYPIDWDEAGTTHWEVTLRCPNCEWNGTGVFSQDVVERFDEELDRGTEQLVRDLKRMMHANMEDEIERDHIVPDDF
jgi:hypothetical protein